MCRPDAEAGFPDTTIIRDGDATGYADRCRRCHYIVCLGARVRDPPASEAAVCREVSASRRISQGLDEDYFYFLPLRSRVFLSLPNDDICIQAYRAHHLACVRVIPTDIVCVCMCVCACACVHKSAVDRQTAGCERRHCSPCKD